MAALKIYSSIQSEEEKEALELWGMTGGVTYRDIDTFCNNIPEDDNTIEMQIHCDGGYVVEGWSIYDRLRATGKEITCIVEGKAASMATVIMMAAPKERRKAYKNAYICVHNPYIPLCECMTAGELEKAAKTLREDQEKILNLYVERCGCDREEMQALMNENKYIDTTRAKEMGLISEIIVPASAKMQDDKLLNIKSKKMAGKKDEKKVEVKASLLDRALAKLGLKDLNQLAMGMDLSTADGQTLTVEREEGEPQVGDKASPDGEFVMPDGKTIVVKDGVITEIKNDESEPEGSEGGDEEEITKLKTEIEELKTKIEELEQAKKTAETMAKTKDELRILNAVKIAGGEKALAAISSNYKPTPRAQDGGNAGKKAEDLEPQSPMRAEIEARKKGEFKKK